MEDGQNGREEKYLNRTGASLWVYHNFLLSSFPFSTLFVVIVCQFSCSHLFETMAIRGFMHFQVWMSLLQVLLILLLSSHHRQVSADVGTVSSSSSQESIIELQHFISGKYSVRSRYVVKRTVDGDASVAALDNGNNAITTTDDLESFKKLLADNALYRIRVVTKNIDGTISKTATASVPACELQKCGFKEDLVLHLDNNDHIMGLSYSSPEMTISRSCDPSKITTPVTLSTRVKLAESDIAQIIPIQVFGPKPITMQNINFDAATDPTAAKAEAHQPFLVKYVSNQ